MEYLLWNTFVSVSESAGREETHIGVNIQSLQKQDMNELVSKSLKEKREMQKYIYAATVIIILPVAACLFCWLNPIAIVFLIL